MNQSESISNLAEALIALQAELPVIPFDSVNPFYKSNYASLKAILSIVRPLLVKHDLTVTQLPSSPNPPPLEVSTITAAVPNAPSTSRAFTLVGLSTRLVHSSGEWIEDEIHVPIEADPRAAQITGSIITYLRRYSLSALLGILADEDTDGEPPDNEKPQPKAKAPSNSQQPNGKPELKPTKAQIKKLNTVGNIQYGDAWDDKRPEIVQAISKGRTKSSTELTRPECTKLIEGIQLKINESTKPDLTQ
jgi:hypothetical protein